MLNIAEITLKRPLRAGPTADGESVVQDRPTLGSLPGSRQGLSWWAIPSIDFLSSVLVLAVVAAVAGNALFPAVPIASLVLVLTYAGLGSYEFPARAVESQGVLGSLINPFLVSALFVWVASLLTSMEPVAQVSLWAGLVAVDSAARRLAAPAIGRLRPRERWVLVGDEETAERLRSFPPLADFASVVANVSPDEGQFSTAGRREAALTVVDDNHADRVVISSQRADDENLLEMVKDFKSIGVPVSMLPRPLDLLDAPIATPSSVGGVPLIEVGALARDVRRDYAGPDRRLSRQTKVSVVVPAINEERNIGKVLADLPDGLHEVILVDGHSTDRTVEVARQARPDIKVFTQPGRGKGDAFRTAFAAVTGNLIVMLDADGSANPSEIPRFVAALEAGADFAKGSRFLEGGGSDDITHLRSFGNACLSGAANLTHGTHFTDLCYGYNAFWARCLPFISLDVPGFEVETLINLRVASAGMRITEVPSHERNRMYGQSNLNTFRDGWRVLRTSISEARRRQERRPARVGRAATRSVPTPTG
jgi:hypothetical protein